MVKARTETALQAALAGRTEPLGNDDVDALCEAAGCSRATLYRSAAVAAFLASLAAPPKAEETSTKATSTKETLGKLRATIRALANCVQVLALRIEALEREVAELRQRANANVTAFPKPKTRH